MNMKLSLSFVVLVLACGMALGDDAPAQPIPAAGDSDAVPTNVEGKPGGHCSQHWHGRWSQYLVDLYDCHSFYECSNGKPVHFKCPSGLCWNHRIETCDWPESNGCFWPCNHH